MYGALEVAERLRLDGDRALPVAAPILGAPTVALRAANLFLLLPESNEPSWWFYDERFWSDYLDLCAEARLDMLDLHGMYNPVNTIFPNALLYFGESLSHPEIGAPAALVARDLVERREPLACGAFIARS